MKDITVVLIHDQHQKQLERALRSLKQISARVNSVIIFQKSEVTVYITAECKWMDQIECITTENNDLGTVLNRKINFIHTEYLLFLHHTDCLTSAIDTDSLHLAHPKKVLVTSFQHSNIEIQQPFLVRTSYIRKHKLLPEAQLPFKEAFLPAWLSTVDNSIKIFKGGFIRQTRKSHSMQIGQKLRMIEKYQQKKINTDAPTLSVVMTNYNMEDYVETAIVSCLLQTEQPEQILMIDDGSTDQSYKKMQKWNDGEQVKVYQKQNGGKARALNDLLPRVTTEFILELDADDWLDADAIAVIKKQLKYLSEDISVLYGNLRKWKQRGGDVLYKGTSKGSMINGSQDLMSYRFPLGPRIYRTSTLKEKGGFPVISFKDGRLYEDVSILNKLIKKSRFKYNDFTVYNVREHKDSITKKNHSNWNDFLKIIN